MPFPHPTPTMVSFLSRPFTRVAFRAPASIVIHQRFYAQQSYGGGEGDPKGEDPQNQGSNPSADLEHPGPPPPAEGQGTGGGPTKGGKGGHNVNQNESSGSSSKTPSSSGESGKSGSNRAQPKIHSSSVPEEQSEDVKQHNREMDDRHGRSQNQVDDDGKDNVGKGFWGGTYNPSSSGKSKLMFAPRSRRQGQESIGREVIDLRVEMLRHTEVTTALK